MNSSILQFNQLNQSTFLWLFITLSIVAHGLFLLWNGPASTPDQKKPHKPTIELTLKKTPVKKQVEAVTKEKTVVVKQAAQQKKLEPVVATSKQMKPTTVVSASKKTVSGALIRANALRWLQQQANQTFQAPPSQLVQVGISSAGSDRGPVTYIDTNDEITVAFRVSGKSVCGRIRPADPLNSLDQGRWLVDVNCNL